MTYDGATHHEHLELWIPVLELGAQIQLREVPVEPPRRRMRGGQRWAGRVKELFAVAQRRCIRQGVLLHTTQAHSAPGVTPLRTTPPFAVARTDAKQ